MSSGSGSSASTPLGYGDKLYWDQRYEKQNDKYDWYLPYDAFKDQMRKFMTFPKHRSDVRVLVVGCGNSELSKDMYDDGYTDILSVDYSEVVIARMRQIYASYPRLRFETADVRDMQGYADGSFDCIVDKGTLDAILCGAESGKSSTAMLVECDRLLNPNGGVFIIVTYGKPGSRLCYLEHSRFSWSRVEYELVGDVRYLYAMRKGEAPPMPGWGSDSSASSSSSSSAPSETPEEIHEQWKQREALQQEHEYDFDEADAAVNPERARARQQQMEAARQRAQERELEKQRQRDREAALEAEQANRPKSAASDAYSKAAVADDEEDEGDEEEAAGGQDAQKDVAAVATVMVTATTTEAEAEAAQEEQSEHQMKQE